MTNPTPIENDRGTDWSHGVQMRTWKAIYREGITLTHPIGCKTRLIVMADTRKAGVSVSERLGAR